MVEAPFDPLSPDEPGVGAFCGLGSVGECRFALDCSTDQVTEVHPDLSWVQAPVTLLKLREAVEQEADHERVRPDCVTVGGCKGRADFVQANGGQANGELG